MKSKFVPVALSFMALFVSLTTTNLFGQFTTANFESGTNNQNPASGWLSGPLCAPSNITAQTFPNWKGSGVDVTYSYSTNGWDGDAPNKYVPAGDEAVEGAGCDGQFGSTGVNAPHCATFYHEAVRFVSNTDDVGGTPGTATGPTVFTTTYSEPVVLQMFRIGSLSNIGTVATPSVEWIRVRAYDENNNQVSISLSNIDGSYLICDNSITSGGMAITADGTGGFYAHANADVRQADFEYGNIEFFIPSATPIKKVEILFWRSSSISDPNETAGRTSAGSFTIHDNSVRPVLPDCCPATNLVDNGSFENGNFVADASIVDPNNADLQNPSSTTYWESDNTIYWVQDASKATDGNRFMYLDPQKCMYKQMNISSNVLVPGKTYKICMDVAGFDQSQPNGGSGTVEPVFEIRYYDAGFSQLAQHNFTSFTDLMTNATVSSVPISAWDNLNWRRLTITITIPAAPGGATLIAPLFSNISPNGSGKDLLLDNVCISEAEYCPNNLLTNASFETGNFTGWTITPGFPGNDEVLLNSIAPGPFANVDGSYYSVIVSDNTNSPNVLYQDVPTTPGSTVNLSVAAAVHNPDNNSQIKIQFLDASNTVLSEHAVQVDEDVDLSGSFQQYTLNGVAPAGTTKVRVMASTSANTYSNGGPSFKTDKWCLSIDPPAPFCPNNLLANGSFEEGTFVNGVQTPTLPSWTGVATAQTNVAFDPDWTIPDGEAAAFSENLVGSRVYQQVAATPGSTYTLTFYSGMHFPAQDNGDVTLEYRDASNAVVGTAQVHDITHQINNDLGGPYTLNLPAAPANAAFVRVSFGMTFRDGSIGFDAAKVDAMCLTETPGCPDVNCATVTINGVEYAGTAVGRGFELEDGYVNDPDGIWPPYHDNATNSGNAWGVEMYNSQRFGIVYGGTPQDCGPDNPTPSTGCGGWTSPLRGADNLDGYVSKHLYTSVGAYDRFGSNAGNFLACNAGNTLEYRYNFGNNDFGTNVLPSTMTDGDTKFEIWFCPSTDQFGPAFNADAPYLTQRFYDGAGNLLFEMATGAVFFAPAQITYAEDAASLWTRTGAQPALVNQSNTTNNRWIPSHGWSKIELTFHLSSVNPDAVSLRITPGYGAGAGINQGYLAPIQFLDHEPLINNANANYLNNWNLHQKPGGFKYFFEEQSLRDCDGVPAQTVCNDGSTSVTLTAQAGLTNYQWFNEAGTVVGSSQNLVVNSNTAGMADGSEEFYFTATDGNNCPIELCCPVTVTTQACQKDYGDLADNGVIGTAAGDYQTLTVTNGPCHTIVTGLKIGATVDSEADGQPSALATGDGADEDGIAAFPVFTAGSSANVMVSVMNMMTPGAAATLYGFIDWNNDGDFGDTGESATVAVPNSTNANVTLTFNVPAGAVTNTNLGARFRLSTQTGLTAFGCANDGEVEDYLVKVCPPPYPICPGESYTLTADAGWTNYQWFYDADGDGPGLPVVVHNGQIYTNANQVGTYYWTATDNLGCLVSACCKVVLELGVCTVSDYGDLADGTSGTAAGDYQTTTANNGPCHTIVAGLKIGATVDAEANGQPSALANGDGADEDGIAAFPTFTAGQAANVSVSVMNMMTPNANAT
ncbi:MAG: GEVED domain-containing protein, partial [Saprospiraceae bacterium]